MMACPRGVRACVCVLWCVELSSYKTSSSLLSYILQLMVVGARREGKPFPFPIKTRSVAPAAAAAQSSGKV